jgi:hypothetical protein
MTGEIGNAGAEGASTPETLRQKDRLGFLLILESGLDAANLPSPNPPKG